MKKITTTLLITMIFFLSANAQRDAGTTLSIGPELMIATGTAGNSWGLGLGGSIQGEHFFKDNISGTAYFGFNTFTGKSIPGLSNVKFKSTNIIPVRVGARYYIGEGFHMGGQLGIGFMSNAGTSQTALAYSLQTGYNFKTSKGRSVDATLKYDGYAKSGGAFSALGIRLAYNLFTIK